MCTAGGPTCVSLLVAGTALHGTGTARHARRVTAQGTSAGHFHYPPPPARSPLPRSTESRKPTKSRKAAQHRHDSAKIHSVHVTGTKASVSAHLTRPPPPALGSGVPAVSGRIRAAARSAPRARSAPAWAAAAAARRASCGAACGAPAGRAAARPVGKERHGLVIQHTDTGEGSSDTQPQARHVTGISITRA